jgi:hypothetical protein
MVVNVFARDYPDSAVLENERSRAAATPQTADKEKRDAVASVLSVEQRGKLSGTCNDQ